MYFFFTFRAVSNKKGMLYKVIERKDPRTPDGQGKYYGVICNMARMEEKEFCQRIANMCTVKYPDVLGVVQAMQDEIVSILQSGGIVEMDDFGNFRGTLNGLGSDTEESYTPSLVSAYRIRFAVKKELKIDLSNRDFPLEKVEFSTPASE